MLPSIHRRCHGEAYALATRVPVRVTPTGQREVTTPFAQTHRVGPDIVILLAVERTIELADGMVDGGETVTVQQRKIHVAAPGIAQRSTVRGGGTDRGDAGPLESLLQSGDRVDGE